MLIPMLCNTLGMWMAASFSMFTREAAIDTKRQYSRAIIVATALDFASGLLVMLGLLSVGSAEFALIYSSCTAWTAMLSWACGMKLKALEWSGVVLVTLGLFLNAGTKDNAGEEEQSHPSVWGSFVLLVGTVLHSASFVYNEINLKDEKAKISPHFLCSAMGKLGEYYLFIVINVIYI